MVCTSTRREQTRSSLISGDGYIYATKQAHSLIRGGRDSTGHALPARSLQPGLQQSRARGVVVLLSPTEGCFVESCDIWPGPGLDEEFQARVVAVVSGPELELEPELALGPEYGSGL